MKIQKKNRGIWSVSLISLTIALVSLVLSLCRIEPIKWDWMGILVGILALLVAALIGWQIITLLDIRRIQREVRQSYRDFINGSEQSNALVSVMISDYYYSIVWTASGVQQNQEDCIFNYVFYRVNALKSASIIKNYNTCNNIIKELIRNLPSEGIVMTEKQRDLLLFTLSGIPSDSQIQDLHKLLGILSKVNGR